MNPHLNGCATHHGAPCDCAPRADPAGLIILNHPEDATGAADWVSLQWERTWGPRAEGITTQHFRADPELGFVPVEPFTTPDGAPLLFFRHDGTRVGLAKRRPYDQAAMVNATSMPPATLPDPDPLEPVWRGDLRWCGAEDEHEQHEWWRSPERVIHICGGCRLIEFIDITRSFPRSYARRPYGFNEAATRSAPGPFR